MLTSPACCHNDASDHRLVHHSFPTRRSSDLTAPIGRSSWRAAVQGLRPLKLSPVDVTCYLRSVDHLSAVFGSGADALRLTRSEEHTSELQSHVNLVCRLLLEKKKPRLLAIIS